MKMKSRKKRTKKRQKVRWTSRPEEKVVVVNSNTNQMKPLQHVSLADEKVTIFDKTEVNLVAFRRTIYLAIQSRYRPNVCPSSSLMTTLNYRHTLCVSRVRLNISTCQMQNPVYVNYPTPPTNPKSCGRHGCLSGCSVIYSSCYI